MLSPVIYRGHFRVGDFEENHEVAPLSVRWLIIFVLASMNFLNRFGLNLGFYAVDSCLFAEYGLLACLLITGQAQAIPLRIALFAAGMATVLVSAIVNVQQTSFTSILLLIVIYLPFMFSIIPRSSVFHSWFWTIRLNNDIAVACALIGILQFFAQFYIHEPWLFDFRDYIPPVINAEGSPHDANTVIPVGTLFKSNGFFFREPSGFSQTLAIALICEFAIFKRFIRIGVLGYALLLTYSGTGLVVLLIGLMFPFGAKTALRLAAVGLAGLLLFAFLGDKLNLSFTVGRLDEFNSETSSAYARFVSPFRLVGLGLDTNSWAPFFGNGPGSITDAKARLGNNLFDPTWAKLVFEYGFFGFVLILAFVIFTMRSIFAVSALPAGLFISWLVMGGHLLSPENTCLLYILASMWPDAMMVSRDLHTHDAICSKAKSKWPREQPP
jgi:hypothetical protein